VTPLEKLKEIEQLAKLLPREFARVQEEAAQRLELTPEELYDQARKIGLKTVDEIVADLARLSPLEYDQVRTQKAEALGVRLKTLDDAIEKARHGAEAQQSGESSTALAPPPPEPWPEEVDGSALLDEIYEFFGRFLVVNPHAQVAVTLWAPFTYLLDIADYSTRLTIISATMRCGNPCCSPSWRCWFVGRFHSPTSALRQCIAPSSRNIPRC